MKVSVVIPAFNETKSLKAGVLDEVDSYLKGQNYSYEVLIVDDGSTDETAQLLEEIVNDKKNFKLIKNLHGGKAIAVMTGLIKSTGEVTLFTDMDQATPIDQLEKILPKFDQGYDIVIGSRTGRRGAPLIRRLAAWGFATLRNLILGLPFKDTQCGFKAFDRKAIESIFPQLLQRWEKIEARGSAVNAGFDVEMLFIARKKGLRVVEVEVEWHHVGTERVQLVSDALEAVKDMIRIRLNDLSGEYK